MNMAIPSLMPAFTNKDVDGISVYEPWGMKLMSVGGKPVGPFAVQVVTSKARSIGDVANGWRKTCKP